MSLFTTSNIRTQCSRGLDHPVTPSLQILLGIHTPLEEIVVTHIIKETCHRVHVVDSGQLLLKMLNTCHFDLVIVSRHLEDLSCLETIQFIRNQKEWAQSLPIIAMLGDSRDPLLKSLVNAGINSFISPPFSPEKIMSILSYYPVGPEK